jgi:polo-like kinase 1
MSSYNINDYPKEYQKKVTLLQHFKSYLDGSGKPDLSGAMPKISSASPNTAKTTGPPIYVKKWMRTRHAIMFRLSNKIVQVNF